MSLKPLQPDGTKLVQHMGFWSLAIYGIGDMLGSGIYGLVGQAAKVMGNAIWLAFVASMVAALLTGLSYACIGSRYPRAAGAAYVVHRAFDKRFLSYLVGLAVMTSGLTSMAAASHVFSEYFLKLFDVVPPKLVIAGFIALLTFVNFWGMRQSTWLNVVCTTVEVGGLLFIVAIGMRYWGSVNYLEVPSATEGLGLGLVLNGAVLTFYSFIGFEDILNVAEEVKDARRTIPRALILAMAVVTVVYMAVSITAVSVVPHAELAASKASLVEVVKRAAAWVPPRVFTIVCLFAVMNTALLNYIMGSRLVYGMAQQGLLPKPLGRVHSRRRTPHVAILTLMVIVLTLALTGNLSGLARATAALLLGVFVIVNAALIVLKLRPSEPLGQFEVHIAVPIGGIIVCLLLLIHTQPQELKIAGGLLLGIACLYLVVRPKAAVLVESE